MLHVMLFLMINVRSFHSVCPVWLFSVVPWFISWFFPERFWDGSSCPYYYCYHLFFLFDIDCLSVVCLYILKILGWLIFLSPEIVMSPSHVPFPLSRVMTSVLLFGMVLAVNTCWFYNMATLHWLPVSVTFGTCWYLCSWTPCRLVNSLLFTSSEYSKERLISTCRRLKLFTSRDDS